MEQGDSGVMPAVTVYSTSTYYDGVESMDLRPSQELGIPHLFFSVMKKCGNGIGMIVMYTI